MVSAKDNAVQSQHNDGYIIPLLSVTSSAIDYQNQLDSFKVVSQLLRNQYSVFWVAESFQTKGIEILPGSFIVPQNSSAAFKKLLFDICRKYQLTPIYTVLPPKLAVYTLQSPKVAIYCGDRTFDGPAGFVAICDHLGFDCDMINGVDIRNGILNRNGYNLVLIPGGMSSVQAYVIYPEGLTAIQDFVKRGNGYLGICAGAYLAADTDLGLNLVTDTLADCGAVGEVEVSPVKSDLPIFWGYNQSRFNLKYWAGPTFKPDSRILAKVEKIPDKWKKPELCQQGCIMASDYEKGRLVLIGPHPESSTGLENFEGMPRLYGNIIFYLTAVEGKPSLQALQQYFILKPKIPAKKKSGMTIAGSAKVAKLAERNLDMVKQIAALIGNVDNICARIRKQPGQGKLAWHECNFVWRMPSAKKYIQKLQEQLIEIKQITATGKTARNKNRVLPPEKEVYLQLQKMQQELPPVLASWQKLDTGMTEFEQEFNQVSALDAENKKASADLEKKENSVLKLAWWQLSVKEYILSAEFIGGESWKYWKNLDDMTESSLKKDPKTGKPLNIIHASTPKGALWTIVQLHLELRRILE
ncbi:MAG: BPL-N domain-containing protein [bacterium]